MGENFRHMAEAGAARKQDELDYEKELRDMRERAPCHDQPDSTRALLRDRDRAHTFPGAETTAGIAACR